MLSSEHKTTEPTRDWRSILLAMMIALATGMLEMQTGGAAMRRTPPVILRMDAPTYHGRRRPLKLRPLPERLSA